MNILVLGHGGHGKGTFCKLLEEIHGLKSMSSSRATLPYIWPALRQVSSYYSPEQAYEDRGSLRMLWKHLISLYNTPDKTALTRLILSQAQVYDGMRCAEEFEASNYLFDWIFWIDASNRVTADESMSIVPNYRMTVIDNNGTLEDLERQVWELPLDARD